MNIYISPSTQERNHGVGGFGTEEARMNQLADLVVPLLQTQGHTVFRNRPEMTLEQVVQDSNAKIGGNGLHVALHTNAGGGKGTEVWFFPTSSESKKLAENLYEFIAPETASPDRGVKSSKNLRELNGPKSPSAIIEYIFHDNAEDVADVLQPGEMERLAVATVRGICKTAGTAYLEKETVQPAPVPQAPVEQSYPEFVDLLATHVIQGLYGSGDERRKGLGAHYDAVQARVNERLGGTVKPAPKPVKSISQLADEVVKGLHGSGRDRMNSLGSNYAAVQKEVNRRLR